MNRWWPDQSRKVLNNASLQVALAKHLIECSDHDTAQRLIVKTLKNRTDDALLLPRLKIDNLKQVEKAQRMQIRQQGDTPSLSSVLGQLLMNAANGKPRQTPFALRLSSAKTPTITPS